MRNGKNGAAALRPGFDGQNDILFVVNILFGAAPRPECDQGMFMKSQGESPSRAVAPVGEQLLNFDNPAPAPASLTAIGFFLNPLRFSGMARAWASPLRNGGASSLQSTWSESYEKAHV